MGVLLNDAVIAARDIARTVAGPLAERTDVEARWPEESFAALLSAGLGGLVVPSRAGGAGLGLVAIARVCEELGTHCSSTALSFGMHLVASAVLAAKATPEQTEKYLEPIAKGRHITTLALSEPGTGSRFYIPETRLEETSSELVVHGTKSFVTNGAHADSYVVSTTAVAADASEGKFSCIVVPKGAPGLEWGDSWDGLGMRGNSSRNLTLDGVRLGRGALLGEEGDQIWYVFHVVAPHFLVAMAGTYVGVAASALALAIAHVRARSFSHSGSALASATLVQHRLGELWAKVERTRALVHEAARLGDAASADALPALCSAKAEVADCVVEVVNEVMTLLGGRGYGAGSPIHRLLRDARAAHVMSPTTEMLRTWTGRALLGVPLLTE